jgi:hypothetical protein
MEPMVDIVAAIKGLEVGAFTERNPHPFLVLTPEAAPLTKKQAFGQTVVGGDRRAISAEATAQINAYRVFRVRKRDDGIFPGMITLGRTANNDIVVPDESVSRLHAYFRSSAAGTGLDGEWEVTDARSRGGTAVNSKTVEPGISQKLRSGDRVRFGQLELLFLLPAELFKMARFLSSFAR